jgi:hypothetical protein
LTLPATITRDNQESTDSSKQNPCKRQSTATIIPSSAVADFILIDALSIQIVALQSRPRGDCSGQGSHEFPLRLRDYGICTTGLDGRS